MGSAKFVTHSGGGVAVLVGRGVKVGVTVEVAGGSVGRTVVAVAVGIDVGL